jgi:hypothetical protein
MIRLTSALLLVVALRGVCAATVSTQEPSALLVFPLVTIESGGATDTVVQLTTVADSAQSVTCFYERAAGTLPSFTLRLLAGQPLAWRASAGLTGDAGTVPALGSGSFTGVLRCTAVDADGTPSAANVLVGIATIEHGGDAPDAAAYRATGFAALGTGNGDRTLTLGGDAAEYDACPQAVIAEALVDGTALGLGADGATVATAATTLALTTCSASATGADASVVLTLVNEFGQPFTVVRSFHGQLVAGLGALFSTGTQGSPTGRIRIEPQASSGGVLGVTVQTLAAARAPGPGGSAVFAPQLVGERGTADTVEIASPPVSATATATAVASPTPTAPARCAGDCNGNGVVTINELITGVAIALGNQALAACTPLDRNGDGRITINELIAAVNAALVGCAA